jgi:hypothetical protein
MSKLGDFLEAVFSPKEGYQTLQASIRKWSNRSLAERASASRVVSGRRKAKGDSAPQIEEAFLSVWIEQPDRMRIATEHREGDRTRSGLLVVAGEQSWECDDQGHVQENRKLRQRSGRSVAGSSAVDRFFSHATLREFFVELSLEEMGDVLTAAQECIRVRSLVRPNHSVWPHWLPYGADEYVFDVLPERGVVLAIQARRDGDVFETNEITRVIFDEPINPSLFHYTPTYGEQVRPADPIIEHLSLEAAIRRSQFTVLVPWQVPNADHAQLEVMNHPGRLASSRPYLLLLYRWGNREQSLSLYEAATEDPELEDFEWEQVTRNGRSLRLSDPDVEGGRRAIALEQSGTHVMIWSDIAREPLLNLAASLVPATG